MNLPVDKKIVLFDGVCNFCNASVRFIVKRDKKTCIGLPLFKVISAKK